MIDVGTHHTTATASRCSCGRLWLDHCDSLSIKNEKLVYALENAEKWLEGVDMQKVGDKFDWSGNARAALKIIREALSKNESK